MTEYSRMVRGYYTSTGVAKTIKLPFVPTRFEWMNKTDWPTDTINLAKSGWAFPEDAAGTAYLQIGTGADEITDATITSGGVSFVRAGTYTYGPIFTISGIVNSTGVVTTTAPHGYSVGDTVLLYGTTGMLQIAGTLTTITAVGSTTTFTIGNIPTAGFAANATAGFVKKLLYPDLYVPYSVPVSGVTTGTTTTIATAVNHQFKVGQEVAFVFPQVSASVWGMGQLDTAAYLQATGLNQNATVLSVTDAGLVVNVNSAGYTAFAYPTSAVAALGVTFPQVIPIGDYNTGYSLTSNGQVPMPQTIPGAFATNTWQGVVLGIGNGTQIIQSNNDVIAWVAYLDDAVITT